MTPFALAALLLTCGAIMVDGDLLQLAGMIKKVTGKSAVPHYSSYGCHCGLGGKGKPLDETDRCCHQHDCCYKDLQDQGCKPHSDSYHYNFDMDKVRCGSGKQQWWRNTVSNWCAQKACECDQSFVQCLKSNSNSYDGGYRFYPNFLCFGWAPQCQSQDQRGTGSVFHFALPKKHTFRWSQLDWDDSK